MWEVLRCRKFLCSFHTHMHSPPLLLLTRAQEAAVLKSQLSGPPPGKM